MSAPSEFPRWQTGMGLGNGDLGMLSPTVISTGLMAVTLREAD